MLFLKNARLKKIHFKDEQGRYMWGFILMAKYSTIEFYTQSQEKTDDWVEALKKFVVLLDMKDQLNIHNILGRGNFARVHLSTRKEGKDEGSKYALKTIEKTLIKSTMRSIT